MVGEGVPTRVCSAFKYWPWVGFLVEPSMPEDRGHLWRTEGDAHHFTMPQQVPLGLYKQENTDTYTFRRGSRGGVRGVRTPPLVIKVLHFYCKTALSQRQSLRRCPLRMPFEKTLNPPLQEILDPRLTLIVTLYWHRPGNQDS